MNGNGQKLFVGLVTLIAASLITIMVLVFNAGGTLNNIENLSRQNCVSNRQTQNSLHKEHQKAKTFKYLFPKPVVKC